jgi:hypothetical protein
LGEPLVTIVTPSLNQGEFIRATIESVLGQDYPHIEYIVMDGGSTDATAQIAAEYAGKLTFISEKDSGQSHAINKGFAMARGEIVAWLNSDDLLLPGAVRHAVEGFRGAGRAGAVYGEGYRIDREGAVKGRFLATEPFNLWKLVYLSDYVLQQATFFRRAAVEAAGGLDESLHYAMDWDLLIRLGKKFGLHYVPQYLGALREYDEAKTFSGGTRRIEEIRRVLERHTGLREAPGYLTYGWQTRQADFRRGLSQRLPSGLGWVGWLPGQAAWLLSATNIEAISRRAQGYHDGWASGRFRWMLPEGCGEVVVRGETPDRRQFAHQELTAFAGGRELARQAVGRGAFEFRFAAPEMHSGAFEFEIRSTQWAPRFGGGRLNWRRAAFRLIEARWEEQKVASANSGEVAILP